MNFYDTSLLKVHYFYDNNNLCYINTISNSNGVLFFEYFGNKKNVRYLYGLNSTTGREILFNNKNILQINFNYISTYHESIIINYENNENYIFTFSPEYCEFININTLNYTYKVSDNFIFFNQLKQASYRNKIIKLRNNNYFLSIAGKSLIGSYLYLSIFNFNSDSITGFSKIRGNDIASDYLNTTECFQTEMGYIECIYNRNSVILQNILKINIYDINLIEKGSEYLADIKDSTFNKIIYLKREIGAYIYFDKITNVPKMQVKYLDNFILKNQFGFTYIQLNGNGVYTLNSHLFLSDGIKINDNKLSVIFTSNDLTHILVCLFEMYNNDISYYLRYFYLGLNNINIKISVNIKAFLFREEFGIAFITMKINILDFLFLVTKI